MIMMALSALMVGVSLVYLTEVLQGGFVGIWFAILLLSGWQTVRAGVAPKVTDEQRQAEYKHQLSGIKNNRRKRRRG